MNTAKKIASKELGLSNLNICIAVGKEKALGENAENGIAKVVCPKMKDRPLLHEKFAQICEIEGDIYSFSFSAVGLLSAKV